ncbi:MAG: hypothetical protein M3235_14795, partial [Actinomycetota bacterium]|nr:hypothetical protein [Actinomycetota bacterium]
MDPVSPSGSDRAGSPRRRYAGGPDATSSTTAVVDPASDGAYDGYDGRYARPRIPPQDGAPDRTTSSLPPAPGGPDRR